VGNNYVFGDFNAGWNRKTRKRETTCLWRLQRRIEYENQEVGNSVMSSETSTQDRLRREGNGKQSMSLETATQDRIGKPGGGKQLCLWRLLRRIEYENQEVGNNVCPRRLQRRIEYEKQEVGNKVCLWRLQRRGELKRLKNWIPEGFRGSGYKVRIPKSLCRDFNGVKNAHGALSGY